MSITLYLLAGIFLPLFPFSMIFNWVFRWLPNPYLRGATLLVWPQIGLAMLTMSEAELPSWLLLWSAMTALFYGFRLLAVRDLGVWTGFLATSSWALLWLLVLGSDDRLAQSWAALLFSVPLALLVIVTVFIEKRFGAAYAGMPGGLAEVVPRLSGCLVAAILAATATPMFPGFFVMLDAVVNAMPKLPSVAVLAALAWMLWSWAGARLLQGFIAGSGGSEEIGDLDMAPTWVVIATLALLVFGGIYLIGVSS